MKSYAPTRTRLKDGRGEGGGGHGRQPQPELALRGRGRAGREWRESRHSGRVHTHGAGSGRPSGSGGWPCLERNGHHNSDILTGAKNRVLPWTLYPASRGLSDALGEVPDDAGQGGEPGEGEVAVLEKHPRPPLPGAGGRPHPGGGVRVTPGHPFGRCVGPVPTHLLTTLRSRRVMIPTSLPPQRPQICAACSAHCLSAGEGGQKDRSPKRVSNVPSGRSEQGGKNGGGWGGRQRQEESKPVRFAF